MSDSRLEKFIYAICSMDVTDLPVPLSRIEKLWNCLITGETPDFEPLSRNEKYLMAMLDRYDISNLPAPVSRGEKLLYKIAVGETDLSDVPGYLSRYEELLKYLIENGGISGGDFEYVLYTINQSLYTLYTTAEKPVKSAILKGNTLINAYTYSSSSDFYSLSGTVLDDKFIEINADGGWKKFFPKLNTMVVKPNTTYTYIVEVKENTIVNSGNYIIEFGQTHSTNNHTYWKNAVRLNNLPVGITKFTLTTKSDFSGIVTKPVADRAQLYNTCKSGKLIFRVMVVEGDLTSSEYEKYKIPYFTGMQSVKMPVLTTTGKNLFDENKEKSQYYITSNGEYAEDEYGYQYINQEYKVNGGETFSISFEARIGNNAHIRIAEFKGDNFIKRTLISSKKTLTVNIETNRIIFSVDANTDRSFTHLQIEQSTQATSYEPYKTNILTVNEDVTLRGIGDVKDELNLLTGELTQRIGEIVLDGSDDENWVKRNNGDGTNTITFQIPLDANKYDEIILDKFALSQLSLDGIEGFGYDSDVKMLFIEIKRDRLNNVNVDEFKQWLSQNPITVQYKLTTESVKTVDLTTVDQDNQPTQLGTFKNVTHVSLESAGLIPEVAMEVATHISTALASASPLMDDISTKQEQLNTTVDEQSENVDATMIATTEIYEETL